MGRIHAGRKLSAQYNSPRCSAKPFVLQCTSALAWVIPLLAFGGEPICAEVQPKSAPADRIGVVHVNGQYHFGDEDFLNEGADRILELGSRVIKVYLTLNHEGPSPQMYPFHTEWPECDSLVELAETPPFRQLFAKPFSTYILTVFRKGQSAGYWRTSLTAADVRAEEEAMYQLARHLLTRYRDTGKTFVLQNWETDWAVRGSFDRTTDPAPEALENLRRWAQARQRGVDRARAEFPGASSRVFHALEVNLVAQGMLENRPCVANRVLPHVELDLISYSAWDSARDPELFRRALDYIAEHAQDREPFGPQNVYVGEFGLPENDFPPQEVRKTVCGTIDTALDWGCPWIVYWQLYCNEALREPVRGNGDVRGFWLVRVDGTLAPTWEYLRRRLQQEESQQ